MTGFMQTMARRDALPLAVAAGCDMILFTLDLKEDYQYVLDAAADGTISRERLDEALELMLEVILSKRPYIRIAGDDFPREIVKSRFLKINSGHLEYVFDCIDKNTTKVGNIKAYLLAALYNAPATMDSYYRAEVNHDLYGC